MQNLPTLPNATLHIEYAIGAGNSGVRSELRQGTTSDTPLSRLGQRVKWIEDRCGNAHLSSATGDARIESCPLLGGRRGLDFYTASESSFASAYTKASAAYVVACVVTTPADAYPGSAWNQQHLTGGGGSINRCFSTSPHRLFLRRSGAVTPTNAWGAWHGSVWQHTTAPLDRERGSTTFVLAARFVNGQPPQLYVDGVLQTVADPSNYAVSAIGPLTLGNLTTERIIGQIGWWGVWDGTASDAEIASISSVLGSWFRQGRVTYGSHQDLDLINLSGQGYTTDGNYHWTSDTAALSRYAADYTLINTVDPRLPGQSHIGDCHFSGGYIYLVAEGGTLPDATNKTLSWFDAETLAFIDSAPLDEVNEVSGCCVVPEHNSIYISDYYTGTHFYRYDLTTKAYIEAIPFALAGIQGITYRKPFFYFSTGAGSWGSDVWRMHEKRREREWLFRDARGNHNQGIEYTAGATNELRVLVDSTPSLLIARLNPNYLPAQRPLVDALGRSIRIGSSSYLEASV